MLKSPTVCVLALLFAPLAHAQGITEEEFIAPFGEAHAAARARKQIVGGAEAELKRASALANPRFEVWREAPESNPRVTNWIVAWQPPLDGRFGLGKKSAEAGLTSARERFEMDRLALRGELRGAFAAWSLSLERREVLRRQLDLVAGLAGYERERARVGEASELAARRLKLVEGEVRGALAAAEADYLKAEGAARAWRSDLPAGAAPARALLPDPPGALTAGDSPEVRALERAVEQAQFDARKAARFWGFPTLQLGWQQLEYQDAGDSGPILGVGWTVPLFDRDQGARRDAESRNDALLAQLELARSRLASAAESDLAAYRTRFAYAREAQLTTLEVEPVIAAATAAYHAGELGLTDLLDSLRSALAAALIEIAARDSALEAHRELEAVLGKPLSEGGAP